MRFRAEAYELGETFEAPADCRPVPQFVTRGPAMPAIYDALEAAVPTVLVLWILREDVPPEERKLKSVPPIGPSFPHRESDA